MPKAVVDLVSRDLALVELAERELVAKGLELVELVEWDSSVDMVMGR